MFAFVRVVASLTLSCFSRQQYAAQPAAAAQPAYDMAAYSAQAAAQGMQLVPTTLADGQTAYVMMPLNQGAAGQPPAHAPPGPPPAATTSAAPQIFQAAQQQAYGQPAAPAGQGGAVRGQVAKPPGYSPY